MNIHLDCIPCFLRQALDAARLITDDETLHEQILRETLRLTETMDLSLCPPAIGQKIHRRLRELTESVDPYHTIKQKHNKLAMELYDLLEPTVNTSDNPLETAIRLAIAGNIIDLGVKTSISDNDIRRTIEHSLNDSFDVELVEQLQKDAANAKNILYLADNAGEIVFDRFLVKLLPMEKITVVVKGYPIINDATMEDAEQVGLTKMVPVIDNGSDGPGTILDTCSPDFLKRFDNADLIISKGQGNYESLNEQDKRIYFILKAKCPVIAADLNCKIGRMILKKSNAFETIKQS